VSGLLPSYRDARVARFLSMRLLCFNKLDLILRRHEVAVSKGWVCNTIVIPGTRSLPRGFLIDDNLDDHSLTELRNGPLERSI